MTLALQIYKKLLDRGFFVQRADDIPSGEQFHLGVGAIITVYHNGTVLVQGKFKPKYKAWAINKLKQILPKDTRWHASQDDDCLSR